MGEAADANGGVLLPLIYRDVFIARVLFYLDLGRNDPAVKAFRRTNPRTQLENIRGWQVRALEFTP